ncbi:MAG TPA: right-handed parallel beta-helix repeat-containing protein [Phycisphaerales bacterium]|nr:right-handed parallel beta-helix repeat-containing protein [Phycisphaerales bacterium]
MMGLSKCVMGDVCGAARSWRRGLAEGSALVAITLVALLALVVTQPGKRGDSDFNNDGMTDARDAADFDNVISGGECSRCDSIDFNRDDVYPSDEDVAEFYAVMLGRHESDPVGVGQGENGFTAIINERGFVAYIAPPPLGDDANPGTRERPKASIRGVMQGWKKPQHGVIYFMEGTYDAAIRGQYEQVDWGGESRERPLTLAADPQARERPLFRVPESESFGLRVTEASHVRVQGLAFDCIERQQAVIDIAGNADDILIEDCVLKGGTVGVRVQGLEGRGGTITIRRNIIEGQRNAESHSQGIYVSNATRVTIEENVFWNTGNRDMFSQGMYLVHDSLSQRVVRRNWVGEPGFAGVQARGGTYEVYHNVFDRCGNAIGIGHPMGIGHDTNGEFYENIVLSPKTPGWGIAIQNMNATVVRDNLLFAPEGAGYMFVRENPSAGGDVRDNRGYGFEQFVFVSNPAPTSERFENNGNALMRAVEIPRVPWNVLRSRGRGQWGYDHDAASFVAAVKRVNPW